MERQCHKFESHLEAEEDKEDFITVNEEAPKFGHVRGTESDIA